MKKLTTALSAIVAILMMVVPFTASAEQIDVAALQLVDPVVTMNDQPMLDMTGLTVQLAGGATADGSLAQVFVDVLAGGQTANSAVVQFSDEGIYGFVGGMQNAYGVSSDALGAAMSEEFGNVDLKDLMTKLKNWTLVEDINKLTTDFGTNDVKLGETKTVDVDLAAGKTTMTAVPFTADATQFVYDYYALLENDAILGPIMKQALAGSEYDSFEDMLKQAGAELQVSGTVASTEDGANTMVVIDYDMTVKGESQKFEVNLLDDNSVAETEAITMTMSSVPTTGESRNIFTMNGIVKGEDVTLQGDINSLTGGLKPDADMTYTVTFASAAGAGKGTDKLDADFETPSEGGLTLSAYAVEETGETHLEIAAKGGETSGSGYFTFAPAQTAAEGAVASGTIELGLNDGTDTYALTANTNVVMTTVNTDDFYIDPAKAIQLSAMTPDQEDAATTDFGLAIVQTLTKIETGVPGLAGITAGLFGMNAQ